MPEDKVWGPPYACTFCCVRIHDLKSTQARQGHRGEASSEAGGSDAGPADGARAEAAAFLPPAPRPRASVTRSSVTSERAPPGRKIPVPKRPRSLGAAMPPAQCLPGQRSRHDRNQAGSRPARAPPPPERDRRSRTGKPDILEFMGSQTAGHNLATEIQQQGLLLSSLKILNHSFLKI